ncbi:MAG: lysylphosphatidylglycerol synthase transmembrane domain-containing protein [Chloroflexi bacterium]|nr:lysylphosphatidylglycerol synthase transmembrane domain-containing protein [Chloroflexota bacterium]
MSADLEADGAPDAVRRRTAVMAPRPGGSPLSRRHVGLTAIGVVVSAVAIWLSVRSVNLGEVGRLLVDASRGPVLAFLLVLATQTIIRAARWSILLPRRHGRRIPILRTLPPLLVGYLANSVLPARLGEPVRAVLVARREDLPVASAFGVVVLERLIDSAAVALLVLPAAWAVGAPSWIVQIAAVCAAAASAFLLVLSFAGLAGPVRLVDCLANAVSRAGVRPAMVRLVGHLREFASGAGTADRRPLVLVAACLSLVAWTMDATLVWLAALSIGVMLDPAQAILIAGVGVFATMIPAAPGYVGTYELAASATAVALGIEREWALAIAVLVHALALLPMAAAGAISVLVLQRAGSRGSNIAGAARAGGERSASAGMRG